MNTDEIEREDWEAAIQLLQKRRDQIEKQIKELKRRHMLQTTSNDLERERRRLSTIRAVLIYGENCREAAIRVGKTSGVGSLVRRYCESRNPTLYASGRFRNEYGRLMPPPLAWLREHASEFCNP